MTKVSEIVSQNVGSAITNFQTWGSVIVNVKVYGAKGNGIVDDTIAIQAAINYAISIGKHEVYFPAGSYIYTVLTNTTGMTFIGDGVTLSGSTTITLTSIAAQITSIAANSTNITALQGSKVNQTDYTANASVVTTNINNLLLQYTFDTHVIKTQYGAVFSVGANNAVLQTRDGSRTFCPMNLVDACIRIEFTMTDGDIYILLGGTEDSYSAVGVGANIGKVYNVNTKTTLVLLATNASTYTPVIGDIVAVERQFGKYVFYKKNTDLSFSVFMTILDSAYATANFNTTNHNLGLMAHNLNTSPNGIVKNLTLNYNSNNLSGTPIQITPINPFVGLTWDVMGDSFTSLNVYQGLVGAYLGIGTINNYGISGTMIADPQLNDSNAMSVRYASMSNSAGLVTIWGGTNDFDHSVPLGTITDTTRATFYGALNVMIQGIITNMPTARVVMITPIQRDLHLAGYTAGIGPNSAGFYLSQYVDAIKAVCALNAVPALDLFRNSGICISNIDSFTSDRLHPNTAGFNLLSRQIASFIKTL